MDLSGMLKAASAHRGRVDAPDYERLEGYFRALAFATRLELLHELRYPRALSELRVQARQARPGLAPTRSISRQAVEEHLDKLVDIGVVQERPPPAEGGSREFVVNGARLYQIMEEFRQVGTILAAAPPLAGETAKLEPARSPRRERGPHLVVAHGLHEGRSFALRDADAAPRGFIVGRKPGVHVSLEYDPFVSLENSAILVENGRHVLVDLRSSRNGTWLNWRRLDEDERAPLEPGDVLGFGRSLLVFRAS